VNRRPGGDDEIGAVFSALADPTRRALVDRLADQPATATELALVVPVSRQAVVKHLQALAAAGLVQRARDGRSVRYQLHRDSLDDAVDWMTRAGTRWESRLAHLRAQVAPKERM
jgi:DNA-binding transcriptional ArsR family regulator